MKIRLRYFIFFLIPFSFIFALLSGSVSVSLMSFLKGLFLDNNTAEISESFKIIIKFRLPVVIQAFLCGGMLAVSGAALQAVLKNPLAEPFVLGVSSGCAFGIMLSSIIGIAGIFWLRTVLSFSTGMLALIIVFIGSIRNGFRISLTGIILSGVIVNSFFSGLIMFIQSMLAPMEFKTSVSLLMGQFSIISWENLLISFGFSIIMLVILFFKSPELDLISLGREHAKPLGVNADRNLILILIISSFITSITVSLCGIIGFVGLVAPHAVRYVIGSYHSKLLPMSFLLGGSFMIIADAISRSMFSMTEIPIGAVTAILGAPFFLWILWKYGRGYA